MENLILIGLRDIYSCSNEDLKKLKNLKERYLLAVENEATNEEALNEEIYKLEMKVKSRSKFVGTLKYKPWLYHLS